MPRWLNILLQIIGLAGQGMNVASGLVPPKYMVPVATGIGAAQAAVAVIAHSYNPDGTNAQAPYIAAK